MNIRSRLHIVAAASAALVIIMALLFSWSQQRLATANKAKNLADEIVSSVFERNTLRNDYLRIIKGGNNEFQQLHIRGNSGASRYLLAGSQQAAAGVMVK
jgi:hypothetical protein